MDSRDKNNKRAIGFSFAWNGIKEVIRSERNFQIHLLATLLVVIAGFTFQISRLEWAIIILVIGFVFLAEIMNTAIEKTIDYLRPEIHPLAKVIKDITAGAVLLSVFAAAIIGLILFLPYISHFF